MPEGINTFHPSYLRVNFNLTITCHFTYCFHISAGQGRGQATDHGQNRAGYGKLEMSDIDQVHLREIPLFSNLPERELLNLAKDSRKITVKGGKCIYKAGDQVDEISFLLEGNIKICKVSKESLIMVCRLL